MTWIVLAAAVCVVIGLYFVFFYDDTKIYRAQSIEFLERFLPTLARATEGSVLVIKPDSSIHVLRIIKNRLVDPDNLEVTFTVEWPVEFDDQDSLLRTKMAEAGLHPRWQRSDSGQSILKVNLSGAISEIYRQVRRLIAILHDTLEITAEDTFAFSLDGKIGLDSLRMDQDRLEGIANQSRSKVARRFARRQLRKIRENE